MLRTVVLLLALAFAAGVTFVNIYTSLVDAPNWGSNIPDSISAARAYYSIKNPGDFFRIFSPANQVLALISLVLCWNAGARVRYICAAALIAAVAADALTFGYFYPRNEVMFMTDLATNVDNIKVAWGEWTAMNWVRTFIGAGEFVLLSVVLVTTLKKES